MGTSRETRQIVRFGPFEADLASGQLRKNSLKIRVQELPFRILTLLVERPGELVTREELQQRLWPDGTFVEFEHSLNTAVNKLRTALGDDADAPRFIETIPRRGYRFIGLVQVPSDSPAPSEFQHAVGWRLRPWSIAAMGALLAILATLNILQWRGGKHDTLKAGVRRFMIYTRETPWFPAISPDGKRVAYWTGERELWVQDLDKRAPRHLAGPSRQSLPPGTIWSPDSKFVAFFDANSTVIKVPVDGGAPIPLSRLSKTFQTAGSWSARRNSIILGGGPPWFMSEIPAEGGAPKRLGTSAGEPMPCLSPSEIPGRDLILCQEAFDEDLGRIVVADPHGKQRRQVAFGRRPVYSSTGHVLYEANGSVWAQRISAETFEPSGAPVPVEADASWPSLSRDGTLLYLANTGKLQQLVWRDRSGRELGTIGQPQAEIWMPQLAPDRNRILVLAREEQGRDIWLHEANRKTRLTFSGSSIERPAWRPDGRQFSFTGEGLNIWLANADGGSKKPVRLLTSPAPGFSYSWSADGQYLLFDRFDRQKSDIWYLRMSANGKSEEFPFVSTEFDELSPVFSPDGHYVAFESNKSGRYEVYVTPFPEGDWERQVSTDGGRQPRWRGDGNELFYVGDETLMAVPVSWRPRFDVGAPRKLFKHGGMDRRRGQRYDVSADGQRFVVVKTLREAKPMIGVVQNWVAALTASR